MFPAWYLLGSDLSFFLIWWLTLSLLGAACWPLTSWFLPFFDQGWLAAKAMGLALLTLPVFLLAHLPFIPFNQVTLAAMAFLLFAGCWLPRRQGSRVMKKQDRQGWHIVAVEEFLFGLCLLIWCFARGLKPDLDSLEKFMNIGFMMSLWRTEHLPGLDMWFAGGQINYYYFGQYVYTALAKLSQIRPVVAYNLGMASSFAFTITLSFSFSSQLLASLQGKRPVKQLFIWLGGLITGLLVTVCGNGQAFFYVHDSPGHLLLKGLQALGLTIGDINKIFWFADSTRFIGYNPETMDKTIHEFPYYSFLVADLHAHVINLAFVLLLLGLLLKLLNSRRLRQDDLARGKMTAANDRSFSARSGRNELAARKIERLSGFRQVYAGLRTTIQEPVLLAVGLLLAIFMMGNFWDFAIYFVVCALMIWLACILNTGQILSLRGLPIFAVQAGLILIPFLLVSQPWLAWAGFFLALLANHLVLAVVSDPLTRTGARMSWLFFIAHTVTLPFNLSFEPIAKTLARSVLHTPIYQLLILWGPHILAGLLFLTVLILQYKPDRLRKVFPPCPEQRLQAVEPARRRILATWLQQLQPADVLVLGLFICGIGLILVPELVYVVDIYSGDFKRANTMFKFTYQAFILLSLVWGYASVRVFTLRRRKLFSQGLSVLLILLLIVPAWYPLVATGQWLGNWSRSRYEGLDGLAVLADKDANEIPGNQPGELADDLAAIAWFNEQVDGQPVILESYGESYTDYCRISTFTGLPTVIGWETHEWLWRTSKNHPNAYGDIVQPRQEDVRLLYTTTDQTIRTQLIKKYQIRYIVLGSLERTRFSITDNLGAAIPQIQDDLLQELGTVVFAQNTIKIIAID